MKTHLFYWFIIVLVCVITGIIFNFDNQKKLNAETEWCRKEQYEAKIENKRLKKELQYFWDTNRILNRKLQGQK